VAPQGGPKKRFPDQIKATPKKCHITTDQLESLAADKSTQRDTCRFGLDAFMTDSNQAVEQRYFSSRNHFNSDHNFISNFNLSWRNNFNFSSNSLLRPQFHFKYQF